MNTLELPFPGRELAERELSYDSCYHKIPEQDRAACVDMAWRRGEQAYLMIYERYGHEADFFKIASASGLQCEQKNLDYVVGDRRYFSDYISGKNKITLYMKSIQLWADAHGLSVDLACRLIMSHEYFHYLEWSELGLTSRAYQAPMLRLGSWGLGRTGIRALSEIGAHAFAHSYYRRIYQ